MDNENILIIGINGQLGNELHKKYPNAKITSIKELDITDKKSVDDYKWDNIKFIINAAAYTNVDEAETTVGRVKAWAINSVGVSNIVRIAFKYNITLVHISTDYVFDGKNTPHLETEPYSPLGVYGQSKAAGDIVVSLLPKYYILRTSWLIGNGKNFVKTMLELANKGTEPKVVSDQIGRLTFTSVLVNAIDYLLSNEAEYGVYNISNSGVSTSWSEITKSIFNIAGYSLNVTKILTKDYYANKKNIAPRPLQSTLLLDKIESIGFKPTDWYDELKIYISKEMMR